MDDLDLIEKYTKGGKEADVFFELLVKKNLPLVFNFVKKFTGDKDNAADITQEVFVKVWRSLPKYKKEKEFKKWLYSIAKNTAIDWLRKRREVYLDADTSDALADNSPSIVDMLCQQSEYREAVGELSKLPAETAKIINMRITTDLTFKEIFKTLNQPLNTIKSRYRRGIAQLKNRLCTKRIL